MGKRDEFSVFSFRKTPRLLENFAQQGGESGLVQLVLRNSDHGVLEFLLDHGGAVCRDGVEFQKQQSCSDSRAFVPVEETLRFGEVKSISGGYIEGVSICVEESVER